MSADRSLQAGEGHACQHFASIPILHYLACGFYCYHHPAEREDSLLCCRTKSVWCCSPAATQPPSRLAGIFPARICIIKAHLLLSTSS